MSAASPGLGWGPGSLGKPTATVLLRHGETALSPERRFAGRADIPLTKEGVRQASLAGRRLAGAGADIIISSPLRRARQSAQAVAEATGAPVAVFDEFAEADFGAWEGLSFAEAGEKWPAELAAWLRSPDASPPGGESFAMVALRVTAGLRQVLAAYRHQTVVLVSHVTPIKTLLCLALLAPPEAMFRMNLDVASVCRVDWFEEEPGSGAGSGSAVVRSLNDVAHLQEPGSRRSASPRPR